MRGVDAAPCGRRGRSVSYGPAMAERDIEKNVTKETFVATLRRLADSLERGEPFRIQVQNQRFEVPQSAALVIEHEVEGDAEELSLELQWKRA